MLSYSELKPGTLFVLDGEPYKVVEYSFSRMQQRKPIAQTKIKNIRTGKVSARNFHQNETFAEAEIERQKTTFLYANRGEYWFRKGDDPKARFMLKEDMLGNATNYLIPNTEITAVEFEGKIISVELPIKIDIKVTEAPPGVKGDSAQGGTKEVTLESGYSVNVPLFISEGDVVRINTESGNYVERVKKA